jgi:hypothetical protein
MLSLNSSVFVLQWWCLRGVKAIVNGLLTADLGQRTAAVRWRWRSRSVRSVTSGHAGVTDYVTDVTVPVTAAMHAAMLCPTAEPCPY